MRKVIIVGASNLSFAAAELLNPREMKLVGFGDTREESWNVFQENGELKEDHWDHMPVMPVELAVTFEPDVVLIAATDEQTSSNLRYLVIRAGFQNDILFLQQLEEQFSIESAALRRLAHRLGSLGVPGAVAELGSYRGDVSWQLNVLFPDRKLYLFDTFQGFDQRDIAREAELGCSQAKAGDFAGAKPQDVLNRLPNRDNVAVKQGWFPETALDLEEETFALAYLDACLYQPTLTGLEFFFPRMSRGGVIVLCGYQDVDYGGVYKAAEELEKKYGAFLMAPLGDLRGTVLIMHP